MVTVCLLQLYISTMHSCACMWWQLMSGHCCLGQLGLFFFLASRCMAAPAPCANLCNSHLFCLWDLALPSRHVRLGCRPEQSGAICAGCKLSSKNMLRIGEGVMMTECMITSTLDKPCITPSCLCLYTSGSNCCCHSSCQPCQCLLTRYLGQLSCSS